MSTKKGKNAKPVSQTDLRKMMQQMKSKRIDPATPNNGVTAGAKRTLNNEGTHQLTAKRAKIKTNQLQKDVQRILAAKAPPALKSTVASLKAKVESFNNARLPSNSEGDKPKLTKVSVPKTKTNSSLLVSGFYSDSSSEEEDNVRVPVIHSPPASNKENGGASSAVTAPIAASAKSNDLPEGFFDDPEVDAKMRGVETPADKMDREWDSFQRELQHEEGQSEQLIDEDKEIGHLDREIEEIDEQIELYNRVDHLSDKKEAIASKLGAKAKKEEEMLTDSEDDDDSLLDWREKDAFT